MQQLALTIVLTSQGIPFLHAGTEFLRSKKGIENSYNSSDSINAIDWDLKKENLAFTKYVEALIKIRKAHPAFRMTTAEQVRQNLSFDEQAPDGTVVYTINGAALQDNWKKIWISFNGSNEEKKLNLPDGKWKTGIDTEGKQGEYSGMFHAKKYSAVILYQ